jgi:CPA2 family monovalent cation:H+ antiporter-2
MHETRPFLEDLALVLCVAAVTTVLFRKLRQPVVLGYLLAGVIVGPHTPIPLFAGSESLEATAELGVVLVMFSIGLDFSLRKLAHVFPRAGLVGMVELGLMLWLGYAAGQALGWPQGESVFAGAIVAISSTMIIAKVFGERRVERRLSDLVLGVLVIEDLAAILLLAILTAVAAGEGAAGALAGTVGRLGAFLFVLIAGGYLFVPRAIRAAARLASPETLLVASVGLCFAFALLAERAGYSVALGAFLAGSLVAESGRGKHVGVLITPLRDLFAAIFFVSVGSLVDPAAVVDSGYAVLVFVAIIVVGKIVGVTVGAFLSGFDLSTALKAGMTMTQIGEFSFIIAGVGVASGAIDPALYGIAVTVSVITTFLTPWLVRASEPLALSIEHRLPRPLRTFASLYGSWLDDLRRGTRWSGLRSQLMSRAAWLALDVLCFAGVVIGTSLALDRLVELLHANVGLSALWARRLVLLGAALVAGPFAVGIVRLSRAIGRELAAAVLPAQLDGQPDMAAAPRRAFVVALQLAIVIVVGGPLLALTQPFVPVLYQAGVVMLGIALLAVVFWRRASDLEGHVRAGAQIVAEALVRDARGTHPRGLEDVQGLLPGLGDLESLTIAPGCAAEGSTLAELDLRGKTGATVVAIKRRDAEVVIPTGTQELEAGDTLALSGTSEAIARSRLTLQARAAPQP